MSDKDGKKPRLFVREDYVIYLDDKIGRGAFSKVYKAIYNDKIVAAKVINTRKLHRKVINQLDREIEIIKILMAYPHPNILKYYKVEKLPSYIIILMEQCSGGELRAQIEKGLTEEQTKTYFVQLIRAYLHILKFSIVHRDIKSTNILISEDGSVKLIDFGLSKVPTQDMMDTMCGSPLYMAPEVLFKQDYDSTCDLWSIGILVYEMTYGFNPFNESIDMQSLKSKMLKADSILYPKLNVKGEKVSGECKTLMQSLLNKDASKRMNWVTIGRHEWLIEEYENQVSESNEAILDEDRLKIVQDIQKMLRKELRHKPMDTQYDVSERSSKRRPFVHSTTTRRSAPIPIMNSNTRRRQRSDTDDNMFRMEEIGESGITSSVTSERSSYGDSELMGMNDQVVDDYMNMELKDVLTPSPSRSIPIPLMNRFTGGSREGFFEFENRPGRIRGDRSSSIRRYLYSRSAPAHTSMGKMTNR